MPHRVVRSPSDLGPLLLSVGELEDAGFESVIDLLPRRAARSSSDLGPPLPTVGKLEDVGFE